MKKILTLIFLTVFAFADENNKSVDANGTVAQEQSKTGFDNMTPAGKAAFIAATPILVVGGITYFVADTVMSAPFDAAKWLINKVKGPEENTFPDLNVSEK